MSIVDKPRTNGIEEGKYRISSKALSLLQCFMSGLDDVIMRFAYETASKRAANEREVRIEPTDIISAAEIVWKQIEAQENLPPELLAELKAMDGCMKAKCQELL